MTYFQLFKPLITHRPKAKHTVLLSKMEDFLRTATTGGTGNNETLKQADSIWRMLDEMAQNDPEKYQTFIDRHLKEGKEYFQTPEPYCVIVTHATPRGSSGSVQRVFINFFSWMRVPPPADERSPVPMTGGQCLDSTQEDALVFCIAFATKALEVSTGGGFPGLVDLAMRYLETNCGAPTFVRNFKVLEKEKFKGGDIKNLRKAIMESKDAIEARDGISKMAAEFENAPEKQQDEMFRRISRAARDPSSFAESSSDDAASQIRIPGTKESKETKNKRPLVEELKPEDVPLQRPVHTLSVVNRPKDKCSERKEIEIKMALPRLTSAAEVELDVGVDVVVVFVLGCYKTEILLPQPVDVAAAAAKFSKRSKMLRISIPTVEAAA